MDILHLVLFAAGFQSIVFGFYLLLPGRKGQKQNFFLAIFLLQLGIDLIYSFFELEKLYYNDRIVFYLPLYITTLPTVAFMFYFVQVLEPGVLKRWQKIFLWSIPGLEFFSLAIILVLFLHTGADMWLTGDLRFARIFNVYAIQLVNIILGIIAILFIYRLIRKTSDYLESNDNWSIDVVKSLRSLKIFLTGFFVFHVSWSVMTGLDLFLRTDFDAYDNLLPYVYLLAAFLTQWISFKVLTIPKVAVSPWTASQASKRNGGFYEAIKEQEIPLVIVDHCLAIIFANQKMRDLVGYSFKELESKTISAIVSADDLDSITNVFLLQQKEAATFRSEFVLKTKKGGQVWSEIEAVTNKNRDKTLSAIFYLTNYKILLENDPNTTDTQNVIKRRIQEMLYNDKVYLDPNLSIRSFADRLEISDRYASMMIKQLFDKNFREIVNELRVSAVKEMMNDTSYSNYSILSIGLEAGFNSKSTFHSVFRKLTGITPAEYQKKLNQLEDPHEYFGLKPNDSSEI